MKDGRPSRIFDIRYFIGAQRASSPYLEGQDDAQAFGQRLVWFLNSEELSLGAYHSLYLCFSPEIEPGQVRITDDGGDWWQRYTYVGVPTGFPDDEDSCEIAMQGTIAALKAIRPDCADLIDHADETVREYGNTLRFLIGSKSYKRYDLDIACTISARPEPSYLIARLTDRKTDVAVEAQPLPLGFPQECFNLSGSIRLIDFQIHSTHDAEFSVGWSPESIGWSFGENPQPAAPSGSDSYFSKRVIRPR